MLKQNERTDDLQCRGFSVIQSLDGYAFTSDSVILANLANVAKGDRVVDLCTGCGVVAFLVAAKYEPSVVYGVEIQERLADMAGRSAEMNKISDVVKIVNSPVQNVSSVIGGGFDVVTVNPPYDVPQVKKDVYSESDICRKEILLTADETVKEAARLLKFGGLFYMINKARRLADVVFSMRNNGIEPKKLYLIQPKKDKDVDTFVVEGKKGGKPSLFVPKPIIVFDGNGQYTDEVKGLYNK
jgi:tRNA1(Val) A37 N6-methylase TrmN6